MYATYFNTVLNHIPTDWLLIITRYGGEVISKKDRNGRWIHQVHVPQSNVQEFMKEWENRC